MLCTRRALACVLAFVSTGASAAEPAARLVLQITVDQLRGDLPGRYLENMGEGGYRYLMDHGIWYADAHHAHANTETIVGHTTRATGADSTQKVASTDGRSRAAILVSTFSDELAVATAGRAKIFGVSVKPPSGLRSGPLPEVLQANRAKN